MKNKQERRHQFPRQLTNYARRGEEKKRSREMISLVCIQEKTRNQRMQLIRKSIKNKLLSSKKINSILSYK
mgnify:CR=1 FL=1